MAHISQGGVSDVNVDPDYVAPPGVAPADAIDQGIPSAGTEQDDEHENDKRDDERTQRLGNDDVTRPHGDDVARPTADKLNDGGADTNTRAKPTKKTQ